MGRGDKEILIHMGLFNRTLNKQYSKLVKLIKSIDSHFLMTENKEAPLRLHLPYYKDNQPIDLLVMKMLLFIVLLLSNNIAYAQRYTGYGRGMDAGGDWDFSPGFKLLFYIILIGICVLGGLIGLLKEKLDTRKEKKDNSQNFKSNERYVSTSKKGLKKITPSHYQAAFVAMLIVIVLGLYIYNSNFIRIEKDRTLFSIVCFLLAFFVWGYPYFDTYIKIDNDGCLEQGCIHPLIGVFSLLFLPIFLHYWLYKGIKWCIIYLKNNKRDKGNHDFKQFEV